MARLSIVLLSLLLIIASAMAMVSTSLHAPAVMRLRGGKGDKAKPADKKNDKKGSDKKGADKKDSGGKNTKKGK